MYSDIDVNPYPDGVAAEAGAGPTSQVSIGARIRQARVTRKIGVNQLDRILEKSPGTVSTIETRNTAPRGELLGRIAKELNVSERWLLTGEGAMDRSDTADAIRRVASESGIPDAYIEVAITRRYQDGGKRATPMEVIEFARELAKVEGNIPVIEDPGGPKPRWKKK